MRKMFIDRQDDHQWWMNDLPLPTASQDEKNVHHNRQHDQSGDPGELTPRYLALKNVSLNQIKKYGTWKLYKY